MQREHIAVRARGRWGGILPALGVASKAMNGKHQPCPMCGGKDRFRYDDKDGKGTFFCSHCGAGDGLKFLMLLHGWDFKRAVREVEGVIGSKVIKARIKRDPPDDERRAAMNRLWRSSRPVQKGDPVALYLARRGIVMDIYPSSLRYCEQCPGHGEKLPAMVAMVSGPDGKAINIHRTYLTRDGLKADVDVTRKMMPGRVPPGSAVRFSGPAEVMGIAEGIETALSAGALFGLPVWSALNTSTLEAWEPPMEAREIVIFGDRDAKFGGQKSAYALAYRLAGKWSVSVRMPGGIGDWNDVLMAKRFAA